MEEERKKEFLEVVWQSRKASYRNATQRNEREDIWRDGMKACNKADQCSWWNWDKGSSIFFWLTVASRLSRKCIRYIGVMPYTYFGKAPPQNQDRQPEYQDELVRVSDGEGQTTNSKLSLIDKGYIEINHRVGIG